MPGYLSFLHKVGYALDEQEEHEIHMFWLGEEKEWRRTLPTQWQRERMFGEEGIRLKEKYANEKREIGLELYRRAYQNNYPSWIRELIAESIGLRVKTGEGKISDEQIARAKEYPIGELLEVRNGMARCISGTHEDKKPSMNCKNNYAYCHTCNFTSDTIGIYMRLNNCSFIEAVKALQ